jgi:pimeloyl-ACP methyl ester carboxylesterase
MPEVRSGEARLHCEVEGAGLPVTVLAHGLTNDRTELAAFTPLVPGTKVRYDSRGHGRSSSPATGYGFEDLAADVDAVAAAFGATVAVGTSLGAGALGRLVCRVPDRFDRMVWLLPAGLDASETFGGGVADLARRFTGQSPDELLAAVEADPTGVEAELRTPWRFQLERAASRHHDPAGLARAIHGAITDHPIPDRELLRRVRTPTLIVTIGGDDLHRAELGAMMAALMPNAELIALEDQAALLRSLPDVVGRVTAFIAGETPSSETA